MSGAPMATVGSRRDRARLGMTIVLVVLLVAALGVLQRRERFWPLVSWNVYDRVRPETPGSSTSVLEVRATTGDGRTIALRRQDLVEASQLIIAELALAGAVTDGDDRAYLARLVRRVVGEDVESLEVWEISWEVDASRSTPFELGRPSGERQLTAFPADDAPSARP